MKVLLELCREAAVKGVHNLPSLGCFPHTQAAEEMGSDPGRGEKLALLAANCAYGQAPSSVESPVPEPLSTCGHIDAKRVCECPGMKAI